MERELKNSNSKRHKSSPKRRIRYPTPQTNESITRKHQRLELNLSMQNSTNQNVVSHGSWGHKDQSYSLNCIIYFLIFISRRSNQGTRCTLASLETTVHILSFCFSFSFTIKLHCSLMHHAHIRVGFNVFK